MAAKTITQRIALEGGDEVRKQLENIGAAGAKAAGELRSSLQKVGPELNKLQQASQDFGGALKGMGSAIGDFSLKATAVVGVITGLAGAFGKLVKSASGAADEADEQSQMLGVSVEQYGRLKFALEQSGTGADKAKQAFATMADSLGDSGAKGDAYRKVLSGLGVSVQRTADGQIDLEKMLGDVADVFKGMPDGVEKTAAAISLFGKRAGPGLIPFLNQGSGAIKKLGDTAESLGAVFTKEEATIGGKTNDLFDQVLTGIAGTKNKVGIQFAGLFGDIFQSLSDLIAKVQPSLVAFAKSVNDYIAGPVKEILAAFRGDTANVQSSWVILITNAVKLLGTTVQTTVGLIKQVFEGWILILDQVAAALNGLFGTNFTGSQLAAAAAIAKVTGAFGVLSQAVSVARTAFTLLSAATGVWGLAILAIGAAVAAVIIFWPQISAAVTSAWQAVTTSTANVSKSITDSFNSVKKFFTDLWKSITDLATQAWDAVAKKTKEITDGIQSTFKTAVESVTGFFSSMVDKVVGFFTRIVEAAKKVGNAIKSAVGASASDTPAAADGGEVQAFAGGGKVRGPGTARSDSVLSWLSNGEFVQQARAVRKYGVGFMHALNRGLISARDVRALMDGRGFALGGLVEGLSSALVPGIPHLANGGLAIAGNGNMHPVTLNFGGQSFPVQASPDVVEQLTKAANRARLTSTGRKPSWYGE